MKTKFLKRAAVLILTGALAVLAGALAVCAQDEGDGTLVVKYTAAGVEIRIYEIVEGDGTALTGEFRTYPISIEDGGAASTLAAYILRDDIHSYMKGVTDENFEVRFDDLPEGTYLITGRSAVLGDEKYSIMPAIVTVYNEYVGVTGKYKVVRLVDMSGEVETQDIAAMKVWSGSGGESEVTAQLLCDGVVYDEVVLNKANNWKYVWEDLEVYYDWAVVEKSVAESYRVAIELDGGVYVITNYYDEDSPGMEEPTTAEPETETTTKSSPSGEKTETTTTAKAETTTKSSSPGSGRSYVIGGGESETPEPVTSEPVKTPAAEEEPLPSEEETEITPETETETVTEGYEEPTAAPPADKLPQTGQLWVPVPVMAFAGVIFIILGISERQKENSYEDEEE